MSRVDAVTNQPRGFIKLSSHPTLHSVLFTLDVRDAAWQRAFDYVGNGLALAIDSYYKSSRNRLNGEYNKKASAAVIVQEEERQNTIQGVDGAENKLAAIMQQQRDIVVDILAAGIKSAPLPELATFLAVRTTGSGSSCEEGTCTQTSMIDTFLQELHSMPLHIVVNEAVERLEREENFDVVALSSLSRESSQNTAVVGDTEESITSAKPKHACHHTEQQQQQQSNETAIQHNNRNYTIERLCIMFLLAPRSHWLSPLPSPLQAAIKELLHIGQKEVVGIEVAYLHHQFKELPAIQHAVDQAEAAAAAGHSCEL